MGDPDLDLFVAGQMSNISLEAWVEASLAQQGVLLAAEVPQPPDTETERQELLWKELINRAFTTLDDRLTIEAATVQADWNPALHPRGPDGKFVSRPWNVPDAIRSLGTVDIVRELADEDPDFAEKVADIGIDGVIRPDESLDEALERLDEGDGETPETPDVPEIPEGTPGDVIEPDDLAPGQRVIMQPRDDAEPPLMATVEEIEDNGNFRSAILELPDGSTTSSNGVPNPRRKMLVPTEEGGMPDDVEFPEGWQRIGDLEMARALDNLDEHERAIRDIHDGEFPLILQNSDVLDDDGITFEDGATLQPGRAAWEMTFEPGIDPEPIAEDLEDRGYLVREKPESESGLFEYIVGVTEETADPDGPVADSPLASPALADAPEDITGLIEEQIDSAQESYNRFGNDGDFHLADPSEIDWQDIEDGHEFARNLMDITPITGMAQRGADKHRERLKRNLDQMRDPITAIHTASRLDSIEQDNGGGAVTWFQTDDGHRGARNLMRLKVSSTERTVNHEFAHSVVDGAGIAHDVNSRRASQYNSGSRNVNWDQYVGPGADQDRKNMWDYMLTDPDGETLDRGVWGPIPEGWDDFADDVEAEFDGLDAAFDRSEFLDVSSQQNPGPNDSWGETLERNDVVTFELRGNKETLVIDEVNQDAFEDGTHQVRAKRLPGEADQTLKFNDDGQFHFGDDRSQIQELGQGVITEEDRQRAGVTPAEELARDAPDSPDERLREFHQMANKAFYRQAYASTEGDADRYKIGSQYSLTNAHETVAKMHGEMTTLSEPNTSASKVKRWATRHPGFFRAYVQNFGLNEVALDNVRQVIRSDRKYGDGDVADGLETLIEGVEG